MPATCTRASRISVSPASGPQSGFGLRIRNPFVVLRLDYGSEARPAARREGRRVLFQHRTGFLNYHGFPTQEYSQAAEMVRKFPPILLNAPWL